MKVSANESLLRLTSTKGNIPRLVGILSRNTGKIVVNDTGLETGNTTLPSNWSDRDQLD